MAMIVEKLFINVGEDGKYQQECFINRADGLTIRDLSDSHYDEFNIVAISKEDIEALYNFISTKFNFTKNNI